jgi:hypothetical protein
LSGYFGQDLEPKPEGCGGCDLCLESSPEFDQEGTHDLGNGQ